MTVLGIAVAGALGAPLRYAVDAWVQGRLARVFPWGTFLVNVSGSALLGLLTGLGLYHAFPHVPKVLLGTGFCGAYTTFSTFAFETVRLLEDGATRQAVGNAVASLAVTLCAAAAGVAVAAAL